MNKSVWLGAVALLLVAAPGRAAPLAADVASDFLAVFNRDDPAGAEAFLRARWPSGGGAAAEMRERRAQSGGYDLVAVERATATQVTEVLRARLADDYLKLDLEVAPDAGHAITRLSLTPSERPADVPPPRRVSAPELVRLVDARLAAMGDFSGAVLIASRGRVIYARAAGLADRERAIANTIETPFGLASMGKMFTAVAIIQLAQAGRLDLDAPVGTYIKDYPNAAFAQGATIRQLLTHTGGAGDFMSQQWADNIAPLKTPADYVAMFGTRAPQFTPGSRFDYSNFGFVILGRVIEVVSQQSYADYLQAQVFEPAGMPHTGLTPNGGDPAWAKGYVTTPGGLRPRPDAFNHPTPAGGIRSTVGDMLAFAKALTGHRLLDAAHTELLITGKTKGDAGLYGYGFEDRSADGVRDIGHDGGGPGENGGLRILADGRVVVVVFSNVAPTWRADKLASFIAARAPVPAISSRRKRGSDARPRAASGSPADTGR